jgi:hypothetical protein
VFAIGTSSLCHLSGTNGERRHKKASEPYCRAFPPSLPIGFIHPQATECYRRPLPLGSPHRVPPSPYALFRLLEFLHRILLLVVPPSPPIGKYQTFFLSGFVRYRQTVAFGCSPIQAQTRFLSSGWDQKSLLHFPRGNTTLKNTFCSSQAKPTRGLDIPFFTFWETFRIAPPCHE